MKIYQSADGQEYFNRSCPYCKESVKLVRTNNNNAIMFDNQMYHKDCYIKSKSIRRICKSCKKEMYFSSVEDWEMNPFVLYQGSNYCMNCFQELCTDGIKRKSRKWKNAKNNIDKYIDNAKKSIMDALSKRKLSEDYLEKYQKEADEYAHYVFTEHDVNELIQTEYRIVNTSQIYCDFLRPLYQGRSEKYKDYKIPPDHLLEMWRTKLPYLKKVYQKNIEKGKEFTPTQHVLYDIAILVKRYEGFLEWKNKQKVLESNVTNTIKETPKHSINYKKIKPQKQIENIGEDDIDSVLNDIFD